MADIFSTTESFMHYCILVSRTLRTRADAKAAEQVHEENGDLEVRRSCRLRQSRYATANESVLFDKLITK